MDDDLQRLLGFLDDLHQLIIHAIERRREIMPPHLREPLAAVLPIYQSRMNTLREEVASATADQLRDLKRNGLTGAELDVKLAGFRAPFAQFQATRDNPPRRGLFGRLFGWLPPMKSALEWADIILGSLTAIFGGKDAVEEIKRVIERGIKDAENRGGFSYGNIIFRPPEI